MPKDSTLAANPLWAGACGFSVLSLLILLYLAFSSDPTLKMHAMKHGQFHQIELSTGNIMGHDASKQPMEAPAKTALSDEKMKPSEGKAEKMPGAASKEEMAAKPSEKAAPEQAHDAGGSDKTEMAKEQSEHEADHAMEKKAPTSLIDEVMSETKAAMKAEPKAAMPKGASFAQAELLEETDDGALPKVNGKKRAADAYAKDAQIAANEVPISVIVTGIGQRSALMQQVADLPKPVGVGVSAYSSDANAKAQQLYGAGHELWLELPMQREDYPASDPGPRGILLDSTKEERLARLRMSLAAMQGYVGLYSDAKEVVSSEAEVIRPLVAEALKRGVYMMFGNRDSGITQQRDILADDDVMLVHQHVGRNILMARDLEKRFILAEQRAKDKAGYVLMVEASPLTLRALEDWLPLLKSRGFALVPPSKIYRMKKEG